MNNEESTTTSPGPRPAYERRVNETAVWTYGADAVLCCVPHVRCEAPDGSELNNKFATPEEILGRFYDDVRAGRATGMHVLVRHCDAAGTDATVGLHFTVQTIAASPGDQPGVIAVSGLSHEYNGNITRVVFNGDNVASVSNEVPVIKPPVRVG